MRSSHLKNIMEAEKAEARARHTNCCKHTILSKNDGGEARRRETAAEQRAKVGRTEIYHSLGEQSENETTRAEEAYDQAGVPDANR